jgi:hypothetical protein
MMFTSCRVIPWRLCGGYSMLAAVTACIFSASLGIIRRSIKRGGLACSSVPACRVVGVKGRKSCGGRLLRILRPPAVIRPLPWAIQARRLLAGIIWTLRFAGMK